MIINISRTHIFQGCRQYAWNWDELKLISYREADPLVIGEGYHLGSEILSKTANIEQACQELEARMRERYAGQMILEEEKPEIERNIEFTKAAVREWAKVYDQAEFKILWPEVSGRISLPGTEHHCWFVHRILHPNEEPFSCQDNLCIQPHHFKFKTDGVIEMGRRIWVLEQKTTSKAGDSNFWQKWHLNFQTRGYCYGVWKTTGIQPSGFLLNAIVKHKKQTTFAGQKKFILDPTNVGFEREPILVTREELDDFEHDLIGLANEYEAAFMDKALNANSFKIFKNTDNCFSYNRRCYYFELCKRNHVQMEGEFRRRTSDYVENEYRALLGMEELLHDPK